MVAAGRCRFSARGTVTTAAAQPGSHNALVLLDLHWFMTLTGGTVRSLLLFIPPSASKRGRFHGALLRRIALPVLIGLVLASSTGSTLAESYGAEVNAALAEGWQLYGDGKYMAARRSFERAVSLEARCPDAYNGIGLCLKNEGDLAASNQNYEKALALRPEHYESLYNLANNQYLQGDFTEAIKYFTRAKAAAGNTISPDLLLSLANVYRDKSRAEQGTAKQEDIDRALSAYQKVLQMAPGMAQAHANLGHLYRDNGQLAKAERELRTAVALKPGYPYALYQLGGVLKAQHEYPDALVALRNSYKYETVASYKEQTLNDIVGPQGLAVPKDVYEDLALGYELLGNPGKLEGAEAEFEAAAARPGKMQAIAWNNVGYTRGRRGNLKGAFEAYVEALKIQPHGMPQVFYNLGMAHMSKGQNNLAEKAFKQTIAEAKGTHALAHNAMGILLKTRGDLDGALSRYNLALMQSGDTLPVVHFNKGIVYEKIGKKTEAKESYQRYLQQSPQGLNAETAKRRLAALK